MRDLQKKLAQVEADLIKNKQELEQANKDLDEKEKAVTNVCWKCKKKEKYNYYLP